MPGALDPAPSSPIQAPQPTPLPTPALTGALTPGQAPFTLGASYLRQPYTLSSETENSVKQFHVADPSWGINFNVIPLDDDVQDCWFTMDITNVDTNQVKGTEGHSPMRENSCIRCTGPDRTSLR